MAVTILSEEWAAALSEAMNSDEGIKAAIKGQDALMHLSIPDAPTENNAYFFLIENDEVSVVIGDPDYDPDVEGSMSYPDLVEMYKGNLAAQTAMMTGKMKAQGNLAKIMPLGAAFAGIPAMCEAIGTEYPET